MQQTPPQDIRMLVLRSGFVKFYCMKKIKGLAHGPEEECLLAELQYISGGRVSTSKRTTTSGEIVTSQ